MCISEYTQIPVNVCFRRSGPQRKHCMCVHVYVAVRWDCSIYAVICHTWLWIHVPFFLPCVWCMRECECVTGRHQQMFGGWWQRHDLWWRPPFCHRRLAQITPSAIFLLCMLMKQREGVMRKEWQIKKEGGKRNRSKDKGNGAWKNARKRHDSVWMCVTERKIRVREQKTKQREGMSGNIHQHERGEKWIQQVECGRQRKRDTNEGHQQPYWGSLGQKFSEWGSVMNMIIGLWVCVTVMNSGCGIGRGYRSEGVLNFKQGHRPIATAPLIALDACFPCVHT